MSDQMIAETETGERLETHQFGTVQGDMTVIFDAAAQSAHAGMNQITACVWELAKQNYEGDLALAFDEVSETIDCFMEMDSDRNIGLARAMAEHQLGLSDYPVFIQS